MSNKVNVLKKIKNCSKYNSNTFLINERGSSIVVIIFLFLIIGVSTLIYGILSVPLYEFQTNTTISKMNITLNTSSPIWHDPAITIIYTNAIWNNVLFIIVIISGIWLLYNSSTEY